MNKYITKDNIKSMIYALIIAFMFRSFAFEPYKIPSSSMEPTLLVGDRLFISKYAYGYSKYSIMGIPLIKDRIWFTPPKRGDVIVFKLAKTDTIYIKRLIGLPGDIIQFITGDLYINNQKVKTNKVGTYDFVERTTKQENVLDLYEERLSGIPPYTIAKRPGSHNNITTPAIQVPAAHYFFMGDNRDFSGDSRFERMGMVPEQSLLGRAEIMFWTSNVLKDMISFKKDPRWFKWVQHD